MADRVGTQRRAFRVSGRVQGVGFRWWTCRVAQELSLSGWVKNLPDGSVEVQAQGAGDALERLELRLAQGPRGARVDTIERIDSDPDLGSGFRVEY